MTHARRRRGDQVRDLQAHPTLAEEGRSLLVYSSDLTEVVRLCDRVITFYRSQISGEFSGDELTETNVLSAIVGHHQEAQA